jgi:DNA polymerase-3 subunit beta
MKIVTTAGQLRLALDAVAPVIERRNTLPILSCVRFVGAQVTGTDLDFELTIGFAASHAEGEAAILFKPLHGLVRQLPPDGKVTIEKPNDSTAGATVTFETGSYEIPTYPEADFPPLPDPSGGVEYGRELPDDFRAALEAVLPFVSTEETRYYLNGICFSKDRDGNSVTVATNGHRLGMRRLALVLPDNPILPRKAVSLLLGLPTPTRMVMTSVNETNRVGKTAQRPQRMVFTFPGGMLKCKLIAGDYPDFNRVIPSLPAGAPRLRIDRLKALAVMRRLSALQARCSVAFSEKDGLVAASLCSADGEKGRECLVGASAEGWPKDFVWTFQILYMVDMLRQHGRAETLEMCAVDHGSPCLITSDDKNFLSVLMPMRGDVDKFALESAALLSQSLKKAEAA